MDELMCSDILSKYMERIIAAKMELIHGELLKLVESQREEIQLLKIDRDHWRKMYEQERDALLQQRHLMMEEQGLDHFWALMSRVMNADVQNITQK